MKQGYIFSGMREGGSGSLGYRGVLSPDASRPLYIIRGSAGASHGRLGPPIAGNNRSIPPRRPPSRAPCSMRRSQAHPITTRRVELSRGSPNGTGPRGPNLRGRTHLPHRPPGSYVCVVPPPRPYDAGLLTRPAEPSGGSLPRGWRECISGGPPVRLPA